MESIVAKGIDVSYAQGNIDWKKISQNEDIDFVIIRATGSYPNKNGAKNTGIDWKWLENITQCESYKIPFGIYHYSYATNVTDAKKEAEHFLNTIKGYKPEYPVIFDFEDVTQQTLSDKDMADICTVWLETVSQAGYYTMLYSMASWLKYRLNDKRLDTYDKWVAHVEVSNPMVSGGIWQYTWKGNVDGISGNVDMNYAYKDYPKIIKSAGLNGFKSDEYPTPPIIDYKGFAEYVSSGMSKFGIPTQG